MDDLSVVLISDSFFVSHGWRDCSRLASQILVGLMCDGFFVQSCYEIFFNVLLYYDQNRHVVVVVVDPTPPTCCQQSPAPEIMWQPAVSPPRWQGKAPLCRDSSRGPG